MRCPQCQTINPDNARFCFQCSAPFLQRGSVSLVGERRIVTVLFADLAGFTTLTENLDAERVQTLLNSCFDTLAPIITNYGGTIDKFIGDEVMVLFGAPQANEDDPIRAVRAAWSMLAEMQRFNNEHATNLDLHIGINTGLVVAGGLGSQGRRQYTVIGETVNSAARLVAHAQRGEVLIGSGTHRMTAPLFQYEAVDAVPNVEHAYKLIGLKARPERLRGVRGLSSPLVGRDTELNTLLEAMKQLQHNAQAVLLIGDAGIGKSRLLAEWHTALTKVAPFRWFEAHCLSYGANQAYHLLREIVRSVAGIGPLATLTEAKALIYRLAATHGAGAELPAILHLLALPLDARHHQRITSLDSQALQAEYVQALRLLLTGITRQHPMLLVLEDIHWADSASIDVLVRLLGMVADLPLVLACTLRTEPESAGWRLVEALHEQWPIHDLALESLPPSASRELVANLLQIESLPMDVRQTILQRGGGNPFFVEEIIRTLIDRGLIVRHEQHWMATAAINTLDIPEQLQTLLLSRIDRLSPAAQRLIRIAAVVGREFTLDVLQVVVDQSGHTEIDLSDALLQMQQMGLIEFVDGMGYQFHHALVQEVAYTALLREERQRLHRAVGLALQHLFPERRDELAATLAHHFAEAGMPESVDFWLLAGDRAYQSHALTEAILAYRAALTAADQHHRTLDRIHVMRQFGRALELQSQYPQAISAYAAMADYGAAQSQPILQLAALIEQAKLYTLPHQFQDRQRAQQLLGIAQPLLEIANDPALEARWYWVAMLIESFTGDSKLACEAGERSLELARTLENKEQLAYSLHDIHRTYNALGEYDRAHDAIYEAMTLWREQGNYPLLADALCSIADLPKDDLSFDERVVLAQEALEISERLNNPWTESYAVLLLAESHMHRGNIDGAITFFERARAASARSGPMFINARATIILAIMLSRLGDTDYTSKVCSELDILDIEPSFKIVYRAWFDALAIRSMYLRGEPTAEKIIEFEETWRDADMFYIVNSYSEVQRSKADGLMREGNPAKALIILEELMELPQAPAARRYAMILLTRALLQTHNLKGAKKQLAQTQAAFNGVVDAYGEWRLHALAAMVARAEGKPKLALQSHQRAVDVINTIAHSIHDPHLQAAFWNSVEVTETVGAEMVRERIRAL